MVLDYVALGVIFSMLALLTASIVAVGSVPGMIARRRGHPWPEAVNAASWVGLVTVLFWPVAFVWAFLPLPARSKDSSAGVSPPDGDTEKLEDRVASLEATIKRLQAREKDGEA